MMHPRESGFIQLIVAVIVVILVIGYFKIDVKAIYENERFQVATEKTIEFAGVIWEDILRGPFVLMFNNIVEKMVGSRDIYFQRLRNERDERTTLPEESE